ncbi:MAG: 50S ribosomal protein L32 [Candidatus Levybacteria bacterium CG_4_9_14_3_um_filter_35_16]|nr:MAG: 50S ribosomal protein L32 [Candidatus Levybacteria bacterium CG22_combo_CG10-13_8_21_14_all_35_11]PIY94647.1 MAG: 50S ribosomal protein L32 [Candidatus Levybacteria bacterium CG_4_10_14_0_8_um_filter_35_23]PIZ98966.1 MAG: 50S ribosomal protein L32 [Candidatus Levybacteria bacterium CG_4_10_14_0_2_um_filter_35_8]PJA91096.1 MAG: 50S ribosomal protein L32 [Candidatus Levybacteria bacterium CG_4_9_14_3_um_filter_35_16]PJC54654.1 MAG: 50S ribosomal protein L32 [Candidatus Levybacteria bacter
MSQEPKRRHSIGRKGKRRAVIKLAVKMSISCANCGATMLSHYACKKCGYYKGESVLKIKTKKKEQKSEVSE